MKDVKMLNVNLAPAAPSPSSAAEIIERLEEAGRTLLAMPNTGPSTRLAQGGLEWIRDVSESYGKGHTKLRPAIPGSAQISRMDQALAWIPLIPVDRYVLRRIVGARSLVCPLSDRHLYSWRRLAVAIGADHKAVQRWHAQGIKTIGAALEQSPQSLSAKRSPSLPKPPRHDAGPRPR